MGDVFGCVKRNFHPGAMALLMLAMTGGAAWAQTLRTVTQTPADSPLTDPLSFTVQTTASGTGGYGLWAQGGGTITENTPNLYVESANSIAAVAQSGGSITLASEPNLKLTSLNAQQAVFATGANSAVNLTGASVNLTVENVINSSAMLTAAVLVQAGAGVSLSDTTVAATSARNVAYQGSSYGIDVDGSGSHADLSGVTINSSITNAASRDSVHGLQASNGGSVTGNDVTVTATRNSSTGASEVLQAAGAGATVDLSNFTLTGTGTSVGGVYVSGGATVSLNTGTIDTAAAAYSISGYVVVPSQVTAIDVDAKSAAAGQVASASATGNNTGALTLIRGSVTATGTGSTAVNAQMSGLVQMTGTVINQLYGASSTTNGQALSASGNTSSANTHARITGDGITVKACQTAACSAATNLSGAVASIGGAISLTNGSSITLNSNRVWNGTGTEIIVAGARAYGVNLEGVRSTISLTDFTLTVAGTHAYGIRADTLGQITLTRAQVSTSGSGGAGVEAVGAGASVIADSATISTTGGVSTGVGATPAHGIVLTDGGSVSFTDSSVTASGASASALVAASSTSAVNSATFTGGALASTQSPAIGVASGAANITASGASISGNGVLLNTAATGALNLTASDSALLAGAAQTAAGGTAQLAVQSGSVWVMSGPSELTSLTLDDGTLRHGAAVATLAVTNPITLASGGGTVDTNSFNATLTGPIAGTGALTKTGGGALTLPASNTYTGATAVKTGTLNVTGSITPSSQTTVDAGATLTGTGTVGSATVANGGIFHPGNGAPGSAMTVTGNLALAAGARYVVDVTDTTASLANVSGAAALGGADVALNFTAPPTLSAGQQIVLMTAGTAMSGTPATATISAGGHILGLSVTPGHNLIATVFSGNAGLDSVSGEPLAPGGGGGGASAADPIQLSATVPASVTSIAASDITAADANATVALFTDNAFTTPGAVTLTVGSNNHLYVKVTAQDGTVLYYDVTVTRQALPPSATTAAIPTLDLAHLIALALLLWLLALAVRRKA